MAGSERVLVTHNPAEPGCNKWTCPESETLDIQLDLKITENTSDACICTSCTCIECTKSGKREKPCDDGTCEICHCENTRRPTGRAKNMENFKKNACKPLRLSLVNNTGPCLDCKCMVCKCTSKTEPFKTFMERARQIENRKRKPKPESEPKAKYFYDDRKDPRFRHGCCQCSLLSGLDSDCELCVKILQTLQDNHGCGCEHPKIRIVKKVAPQQTDKQPVQDIETQIALVETPPAEGKIDDNNLGLEISVCIGETKDVGLEVCLCPDKKPAAEAEVQAVVLPTTESEYYECPSECPELCNPKLTTELGPLPPKDYEPNCKDCQRSMRVTASEICPCANACPRLTGEATCDCKSDVGPVTRPGLPPDKCTCPSRAQLVQQPTEPSKPVVDVRGSCSTAPKRPAAGAPGSVPKTGVAGEVQTQEIKVVERGSSPKNSIASIRPELRCIGARDCQTKEVAVVEKAVSPERGRVADNCECRPKVVGSVRDSQVGSPKPSITSQVCQTKESVPIETTCTPRVSKEVDPMFVPKDAQTERLEVVEESASAMTSHLSQKKPSITSQIVQTKPLPAQTATTTTKQRPDNCTCCECKSETDTVVESASKASKGGSRTSRTSRTSKRSQAGEQKKSLQNSRIPQDCEACLVQEVEDKGSMASEEKGMDGDRVSTKSGASGKSSGMSRQADDRVSARGSVRGSTKGSIKGSVISEVPEEETEGDDSVPKGSVKGSIASGIQGSAKYSAMSSVKGSEVSGVPPQDSVLSRGTLPMNLSSHGEGKGVSGPPGAKGPDQVCAFDDKHTSIKDSAGSCGSICSCKFDDWDPNSVSPKDKKSATTSIRRRDFKSNSEITCDCSTCPTESQENETNNTKYSEGTCPSTVEVTVTTETPCDATAVPSETSTLPCDASTGPSVTVTVTESCRDTSVRLADGKKTPSVCTAATQKSVSVSVSKQSTMVSVKESKISKCTSMTQSVCSRRSGGRGVGEVPSKGSAKSGGQTPMVESGSAVSGQKSIPEDTEGEMPSVRSRVSGPPDVTSSVDTAGSRVSGRKGPGEKDSEHSSRSQEIDGVPETPSNATTDSTGRQRPMVAVPSADSRKTASQDGDADDENAIPDEEVSDENASDAGAPTEEVSMPASRGQGPDDGEGSSSSSSDTQEEPPEEIVSTHTAGSRQSGKGTQPPGVPTTDSRVSGRSKQDETGSECSAECNRPKDSESEGPSPCPSACQRGIPEATVCEAALKELVDAGIQLEEVSVCGCEPECASECPEDCYFRKKAAELREGYTSNESSTIKGPSSGTRDELVTNTCDCFSKYSEDYKTGSRVESMKTAAENLDDEYCKCLVEFPKDVFTGSDDPCSCRTWECPGKTRKCMCPDCAYKKQQVDTPDGMANAIKDIVKHIECVCAEAEKQQSIMCPGATSYDSNVSGLQMALTNLQDKCKVKDQMIDALTRELKVRANSKVFDEMLRNISSGSSTATDYDRRQLCQQLPHPQQGGRACDRFPKRPSQTRSQRFPSCICTQPTPLELYNCLCGSQTPGDLTAPNNAVDCRCSSKPSIGSRRSPPRTEFRACPLKLMGANESRGSSNPSDCRECRPPVEVVDSRGSSKRDGSNCCCCSKPDDGAVECRCSLNIDPAPLDIVQLRKTSPDSLLVKWVPPASEHVIGYEIDIDGQLKSRVLSPTRTTAVLYGLNLSSPVTVSVYAMSKFGRCTPPATAVFPR